MKIAQVPFPHVIAFYMRFPFEESAAQSIASWLPGRSTIAIAALLLAAGDSEPLSLREQELLEHVPATHMLQKQPQRAPSIDDIEVPDTSTFLQRHPRDKAWVSQALIHLPFASCQAEWRRWLHVLDKHAGCIDASWVDARLPLAIQARHPSWPHIHGVRKLFPSPNVSEEADDAAYAPPSSVPLSAPLDAREPRLLRVSSTHPQVLPSLRRVECLNVASPSSLTQEQWEELENASTLCIVQWGLSLALDAATLAHTLESRIWSTVKCPASMLLQPVRTLHLDVNHATPELVATLLASSAYLVQLTVRGSESAFHASSILSCVSLRALHVLDGATCVDDLDAFGSIGSIGGTYHREDPQLWAVTFDANCIPVRRLLQHATHVHLLDAAYAPEDFVAHTDLLQVLDCAHIPSFDCARNVKRAIRCVQPVSSSTSCNWLDRLGELSVSSLEVVCDIEPPLQPRLRSRSLRHLTLHLRCSELALAAWLSACKKLTTLTLHLEQPLTRNLLDVSNLVSQLTVHGEMATSERLVILGGDTLTRVVAPFLHVTIHAERLESADVASLRGSACSRIMQLRLRHHTPTFAELQEMESLCSLSVDETWTDWGACKGHPTLTSVRLRNCSDTAWETLFDPDIQAPLRRITLECGSVCRSLLAFAKHRLPHIEFYVNAPHPT